MSTTTTDKDTLSLLGITENNLQNIDLVVDHNQLIVITGISGSGKSSLAFDTIYPEGARRYIETFSPYTRQFLERLHSPQINSAHGIRPALALEQRNKVTNSRSTVGTVSEINDYLKLVWSNLSSIICPNCNHQVKSYSVEAIIDSLSQLLESNSSYQYLAIAFPAKIEGKASIESLKNTFLGEGFLRYFSEATNSINSLEDLNLQEISKNNFLQIVIDRISLKKTLTNLKELLTPSLNQAYTFGHGALSVIFIGNQNYSFQKFTSYPSCNICNLSFPIPKPSLFSFNSPLGACPECQGFGKILKVSEELCIPDPQKSLADKALICWSTPATQREFKSLLKFCEEENFPTNIPWRKLPQKTKNAIFSGSKNKKFRGVYAWFDKLLTKRHKMHVRVFLSRYRSEVLCPQCQGTRLNSQALLYQIAGKTLPEIWTTPIDQLYLFFEKLLSSEKNNPILETALNEVNNRLGYLNNIGLGYLTLDRQTRTLSGGESQRVNLTSILGSRLSNTSLILDEPTIGLHARDTKRLIAAFNELKSKGNTVFVVEHDPEVMLAADEIIDLGPGSGSAGGKILFQGPPIDLKNVKNSLTGNYLKSNKQIPFKQKLSSKISNQVLSIIGARANNLKSIDIHLPLNNFVILSGVSGSGKSSLITTCLYQSYNKLKQGFPLKDLLSSPTAPISDLQGLDLIDEILLIDQSPVGKSPRSNAATYTKAWEIIRECLASTDAAQKLGLSKSAFSFNVPGGRCPVCEGAGYHKIEMQFLADVFVECETCNGTRFQDKVFTVNYAGKNVLDLLNMSLDQVAEFFRPHSEDARIRELNRRIQPMIDLGLGYLKLGQPLNQVSGGEAQRIKLASYLAGSQAAKKLFILDEPSTGLHPANISMLLDVLRHLVDLGHSVVCVEHNLDLIANADWIIDLGPEGGESGGLIVAEGSPQELLNDIVRYPQSQTLVALAQRSSSTLPIKLTKDLKVAYCKPKAEKTIRILGARHHNLKNISVSIPQNKLTVITGVSGSGKSTLAFDILFSEGQRRYIDCLSPYARQFMTQLQRAEVDLVDSIPPTIAISQKTAPPMGISTLATTTEIYQYLRLLFCKLGTLHCPEHNIPITSKTSQEITEEIIKRFPSSRIFLFAPVISGRKGYYNDLFNRALRAELTEARIDGSIVKLTEDLRLDRHTQHWISLLVASISKPQLNPNFVKEAIDQCLLHSNGVIEVAIGNKQAEPILFSTDRVCPKCNQGFRELDPQDFSFRSNRGKCENCEGRGYLGEDYSKQICGTCQGTRLASIGRHVYIDTLNIAQVCSRTAPELKRFISELKFDSRLEPIIYPIRTELLHRLQIISSVGLDYLNLDRDAWSISGGEAQRLRLARALGSPLTDVCYILDEPSIGLHPTDHHQLMQTLFALRDQGNTIVVVEHDEETICQADHIIDVGPTGGAGGGHIVAQGTFKDIINNPNSVTGQALSSRLTKSLPLSSAKLKFGNTLKLSGATTNNLKNVTAHFPLNKLTVVAGVSGSGKSSLIHGTLVPAIFAAFAEDTSSTINREHSWKTLSNHQSLKRYIEIDQTPLGKTSTSAPASYLGIFDNIRKVYALLPEAQARGWNASFFSFNTGKGRCPNCSGRGFIRIPMSFLPDAVTECEVCNGLRYTEDTLEVKFQGLSIGKLLKQTMSEAREVFLNHPSIRPTLDYINSLGLGYLTLGQPSHTLSGGEAQRLKIARELSSREARDTLYILDEPTIGLHMTDVDKLMSVLNELVALGNTVIVIEHNLDIIRSADYLIELGPGPGDQGGQIIFSGTPGELILLNTPTGTALKHQAIGLAVAV